MSTAYVLIQALPGAVDSVVDEMSSFDQVEFVDPVAGPYDAIVGVGGTVADVEPVRERLSQIEDVTSALTCLAGSGR